MAARDVVSLVTQRPLAHQSSYRFHRSALSISYAYTMAIPCGACPPVAAGRTGASGQARTDPHQSLRLAGRVGSVQFALPLHCTCTASPPPVWLGRAMAHPRRPDDRRGRRAGTVPSLRASDFFDGCWRTTPRPGGPVQRGAPPRFGRSVQSRAGMCGVSAAGPRPYAPGRAGTLRRRGEATRASACLRRAGLGQRRPGWRRSGRVREREIASTRSAGRMAAGRGLSPLSRRRQQVRPDTDERALRFTQRDGSSRQ
jgi:hypothetical protein